MTHYHPEDRPDPSEQPIRARVPEHVAAGAFSTGVIVMTAQSEFILDFVQNLGRPHQIIARVVMPHHVLPQLVDALQRNMELYRNRWGELPQTGMPKNSSAPDQPGSTEEHALGGKPQQPTSEMASLSAKSQSANSGAGSGGVGPGSGAASGGGANITNQESSTSSAPKPSDDKGSASTTRQASVQEIYDDLKIRDEFLSGAYANAVMIGHGPHEFSFDFITNFYPHSAVSSRVFLAAGQIPRLYDSLKGTWEQLRTRMQQPPNRPAPPPDGPDEPNPFA